MENIEIPCSLVKIPQWGMLLPEENPELKDGRYSNCYLWDVPVFVRKKWAILGYIDVDFQEYLDEGYSEEQIVQACIRHLNQPPLRKKYQRRVKTPLYGILDESAHSFKFRKESKFGRPVIEVELLTNKRKNRRLWGEGQKQVGFKGLKKLGRPRKNK